MDATVERMSDPICLRMGVRLDDVSDVLALIDAAKPYLTDEYEKARALGMDPIAAARALLGRADALLAGMAVDA